MVRKITLGKVDISFTNKWFYTFIAVGIIALLGVVVYAVAGNIPNPGHSHAELQPCSDGEVLQMSGTSWSCVSLPAGAVADNLGNHIATQNIQLNGKYLSNDGGSEGISIDDNGNLNVGGNIGIGKSPATGVKLDVDGDIKFSGKLHYGLIGGGVEIWNRGKTSRLGCSYAWGIAFCRGTTLICNPWEAGVRKISITSSDVAAAEWNRHLEVFHCVFP